MGGFGSAVWESLSDGGAAPRMLRVGLPDRYVTHGAPKLLHEEVGYTAERIAERIEAAGRRPGLVAAAEGSAHAGWHAHRLAGPARTSTRHPDHQHAVQHQPRLVVIAVHVQRRHRPGLAGPVLDHQLVGHDH